ncbi:hypothetical protein JHK82_031903 [Glycine max]|nr:hypothetical protein JHK85_032566 [Glycine max]KAG4995173.1 hypothetical protein JHK86_032000 [Glycine max]KAG5125166.1 hypothetical protein JHK82_031903 [Glycine max]
MTESDSEEVKKVIGIALLCTQASSAMRPAMSECNERWVAAYPGPRLIGAR